MIIEALSYPFLFAAIYFEVFLLITFLSRPAREVRTRIASTKTPLVAMIVPCYNEENTIKGTVDSLLALEYPKDRLRIVLVNDGSTDGTKNVMNKYIHHTQVTIIHKENGGKDTALNAGIDVSEDTDLIGCLDADSFVEKNALKEIVTCFDNENVGAATSSMTVYKPRTILEHIQSAEYLIGVLLRHILASVNGLYVTPGPFSLYRTSAILTVGGFRKGYNTEDMEMALRMQKAGFVIENSIGAQVFTKVPNSVPKLIKQRTRWTTGFLRNIMTDYRDLVGNPRYGALGLLVLPLGIWGIFGAIILTAVAIYATLSKFIETVLLTQGIPLSYVLLPQFSFDWFYIPISSTLLFTVVALLGCFLFVFMGKQMSKKSGTFWPMTAAYLLIYSFIAPIWFVRSLIDVSRGLERPWN